MHHRALRTVSLGVLLLAGCSSSGSAPEPPTNGPPSSPDGGLPIVAPDGGPPPVVGVTDAEVYRRSFMVVNAKTLGALDAEFAMGSLMYAVNQHIVSKEVPAWNAAHPDDPKKTQSDREFAVQPFKGASDDVEKNNEAADGTRYGVVSPTIDTFQERIIPVFKPDVDPVGPFHLTAVVNRVDLTGDIDLRGGGQLAGAERRWFGEARFVYGLREPYDAKTPYPITFIMEYRLPALKKSESGEIVADPSFDFARGPASMEDWIERRKLWPEVWARLAAYEPGSDAYTEALRATLRLFATGKNHITLRTGERIRDAGTGTFTNEFEYHEFYLNGNWALARRKMRREPFACSANSILGARIDEEWNATAGTMAWNYTTGERNLETDEVAAAKAGCGGQLPYAQFDEDRGDGTQLRSKFSRFTPSTVWLPKGTAEPRRHAFAIGSCTGCHAAETGTPGFHIAPSLMGQDAILSPFLLGATSATPNGTAYAYDEPTRRMTLSKQFADGVDVPGDDLHHLECVDDTCSVK